MIKITKNDIAGLLYCISAIDKKAPRESMRCVLVLRNPDDTCSAYCTDGYRMHSYELQGEYTPGVYEVIKATKSEVILGDTDFDKTDYPDVLRVIPAYQEEQPTVTLIDKNAFTRLVRKMHETRSVDMQYFKDAVVHCLSIFELGVDRPVVFKGSTTLGIVMPCKVEV